MSDSAVASRALMGMQAPRVTVETHLPGGLPGFTLVGLPEAVVREARDRVKSAIQNCGYQFPRGRVVVNLAPADLAKEGARYDLPIAVSILCATGQIPHAKTKHLEFVGELSLYGDLRPVRGILSAVQALMNQTPLDEPEPPTLHSTKTDSQPVSSQATRVPSKTAKPGQQVRLVMPTDNAGELVARVSPMPLVLNHLSQLPRLLVEPEKFVSDTTEAAQIKVGVGRSVPTQPPNAHQDSLVLDDVIAQQGAKRALTIAAAGGHHLLMVGPPGSGKTLLARCLRNLLPPLLPDQAMNVAAIHSVAGQPYTLGTPPFREPHHSVTAPAMAGGGSRGALAPGEISLAHHGVLFLDELPHFKPSVLDLLREPLSNGYISIHRAHQDTQFPAQFQLLCAMNPCPAGLVCTTADCRCTARSVSQYQSRVSGPLLDRIDLQINVPALSSAELVNTRQDEPKPVSEHATACAMIAHARARAQTRQGCLNAEQQAPTPEASLHPGCHQWLEQAVSQLKLSARGYHRVLRVAQTIADLATFADGDTKSSKAEFRKEKLGTEELGTEEPGTEQLSTQVRQEHLEEALAYRRIDWQSTPGL